MVENNYLEDQIKLEDEISTAVNYSVVTDYQEDLSIQKEEIVETNYKTEECDEVNWIEVEHPSNHATHDFSMSNLSDSLINNRQSFDKDSEAQIQTVADMVCDMCRQVTFRK